MKFIPRLPSHLQLEMCLRRQLACHLAGAGLGGIGVIHNWSIPLLPEISFQTKYGQPPPPLPAPDHPSPITCLLELETYFCFHLFTVLFSFLEHRNRFPFPMCGIWKRKHVSVSKWSPWKWKCVSVSNVLRLETTPIETILENSILNQQP